MKILQRATSIGKPLLFGVAAVCGWIAPVAFAEPPAPPYVGVSYYPEVAGGQITNDIAKMRDIG